MAGLSDPSLASKLTESLNGLYAGGYLAGVFYGLTTHQTFVYFRRSGNGNLYTRLLVLLLWILDTLHAVLGAVALRKLMQEAIVNPLGILIDRVPWTLSFSLFIMSISDSGVRGFYCYRIWRLSNKNRILTALTVFPGICALIAGLYSTSQTVRRSGAQSLDPVTQTALDTTLISIVVADSILAGFLCVLLWNIRSGIKRTNSVISTLILYTVTTGLLTSLMAIATLIIMLSMKETLAYNGALYTLSKLNFSSLLATLNRRQEIRTQMDATGGIISIPLQTVSNIGLTGTSIISFKSGDEVTNARSAINIKQRSDSDNDPESQVGGGLGLGLHGKSALQHIDRIEIKVETSDMAWTHSNGGSGYTGPREHHDVSIV